MNIVKTFIGVGAHKNTQGIVDIFDDKVFFVSRFDKNWYDARNFCRRLNALLTHSIDYETNMYLFSKMKNVWLGRADVWIGARGYRWRKDDDTSVWMSEGYSDWAPGEPSTRYDPSLCVYMWGSRNYSWDDTSCSYRCKFVCSRSLQNAGLMNGFEL